MALVEIAKDVWGWGSDLKMAPGVHLPARAVVIRLSGGKLVLHSPLRIDDALAAELDALGEVAWVVAPNSYHHLFVRRALERYPDAELVLVPALRAKIPDLPAGRLLTDGAPEGWGEELVGRVLPGQPKLDEALFLHVPSKTLIVTDWVFNVHRAQGFGTKLVMTLMGTWKKTKQSRLIRMFIKDKAAAAAAMGEVLAWDYERVVPAHGDVIDGPDARARFERAVAGMMG